MLFPKQKGWIQASGKVCLGARVPYMNIFPYACEMFSLFMEFIMSIVHISLNVS